MCVQGQINLLFFFQYQKSQYHSQCLRLMLVSVSVSIVDTKVKSLSISLNFWDQFKKSQYQSQFLTPIYKVSVSKFDTILKVSVSVSKIETWYPESQSQLQHRKKGLAHPWCGGITIGFYPSYYLCWLISISSTQLGLFLNIKYQKLDKQLI